MWMAQVMEEFLERYVMALANFGAAFTDRR
jgi:hypothetical protein